MNTNPQESNNCSLEPESGSCKALIPKYYFDQTEQICKEFTWGGCDGVVPFNTLEECKLTCENDEPNQEEFCGSSTYAECTSNDDCVDAGCSGQICKGKDEPGGITTCEFRECYNNEKYDLTCQCINNQCQWS
jgi:eight-cysteine-cluster-containing protein